MIAACVGRGESLHLLKWNHQVIVRNRQNNAKNENDIKIKYFLTRQWPILCWLPFRELPWYGLDLVHVLYVPPLPSPLRSEPLREYEEIMRKIKIRGKRKR